MRILKINKKRIVIGIILLVCCIYAINFYRDRNFRAFQNEILAMDKSVETVNLNSLTPFEWDKVYLFNQYVGDDVVYRVVGYRFGRASPPLVNQSMQMVFVKDGKVVCYDHGNHARHDYSIWYAFDYNLEPQYAVLYSKDNPVFAVRHHRYFTFIVYPVDHPTRIPLERNEDYDTSP